MESGEQFVRCGTQVAAGDSATSGNLNVNAEVNRVSLKAPEFMASEPEVWFALLEMHFRNAGITADASKFRHVLTALPPHVTAELKDLILRPPIERQFETLKSTMLRRYGVSREHKTRQLLDQEEIGDRRPSQFLRHLRNLAENSVSDDILKIVWMSRLPKNIQPTLLTRTDSSLDQLVDMADAILDFMGSSVGVSQVNAVKTYSAAQTVISQDQLQQTLSTLTLAISELTKWKDSQCGNQNRARRSSSRVRFRPRSRSASRGRNPPPGICWYHWRWANEVRKCVSPCSARVSEVRGDKQ